MSVDVSCQCMGFVVWAMWVSHIVYRGIGLWLGGLLDVGGDLKRAGRSIQLMVSVWLVAAASVSVFFLCCVVSLHGMLCVCGCCVGVIWGGLVRVRLNCESRD